MPKGKTPSLVSASNGRPKRVHVKRRSKCSRCDCTILVGADCFNVPRSTNGFSVEKRFCKACYDGVLDQTQKDLNELRML